MRTRNLARGVLVGCDLAQEDLLSAWWDHYTLFNDEPVAFADFGMSSEARIWCQARGISFPVPSLFINEEEIPLNKRILWEAHYGSGIWNARKVWFRKPLAWQASPFDLTLWLDLDCHVQKPLGSLFATLCKHKEIALRAEKESVQKKQREKGFIGFDETDYNTGVALFFKKVPILQQWIEEIEKNNAHYVFEQQALAKVLRVNQNCLQELLPIHNWSMERGANLDAVIYHYHGGCLKKQIPRHPLA